MPLPGLPAALVKLQRGQPAELRIWYSERASVDGALRRLGLQRHGEWKVGKDEDGAVRVDCWAWADLLPPFDWEEPYLDTILPYAGL